MSEYEITAQEAEFFLNMEKIKINNKEWDLPDLGGKISVPIISLNKKEHFWLDISRKRVNLKKYNGLKKLDRKVSVEVSVMS